MKPSLPNQILLLLLTITIAPVTATAEARLAKHKNVVILLADDLGWGDVGFNGGTADTPHIDQLAADGVRLNRFYAYPACSPARAALLTGRFPQRYGINGPVRPRDPGLPTNERLLPTDFQQAGYRTSLIGKWHLGQSTEPESHPNRRGFDQFYGFISEAVDYDKHTNLSGQLDWQRDGKTINERGYATDLLTEEAVQQIAARDRRVPFCMVVSFNAPHSPFQAPENRIAQYCGRMNEREATYAAMIDSLDQGIGRILTAIEKQNIRDETIVLFTSDNGAARIGKNTPFRGQKREVYEGGIHVPCIIRAPGVLKAGTQSDQLCAIHDLFPTLASAANVSLKVEKPLDGQDLWSNLVDEEPSDRSLVIAENDYAAMHGDWKLILPNRGGAELYNLRTDASETTSLADSEPKIVNELTTFLTRYRQRIANDLPAKETNDAAILVSTNEPQEGELLHAVTLQGDAVYGVLGDARVESNGRGVRLLSNQDIDGNDQFAGEATLPDVKVDPNSRWYRFYISGLAQDDFAVSQDNLYLKVEFFKNNGKDSLDLVKTRIYPKVLQERET